MGENKSVKAYILDLLREYLIINDIEIEDKENFKTVCEAMNKEGYFYKLYLNNELKMSGEDFYNYFKSVFGEFAESYAKDNGISTKDSKMSDEEFKDHIVYEYFKEVCAQFANIHAKDEEEAKEDSKTNNEKFYDFIAYKYIEAVFNEFASVYERDADILEKDLIFGGSKRVLDKINNNGKIKR